MLHQPAEAFQPSTGGCPVAEMGRAFQRHVDLFNLLEKRDSRSAFGQDKDVAAEIHTALGDAAPFVQARSAEGALFQLILSHGAAASLYDAIPEDNPSFPYLASRMREIDASLTSIRRFLESHFGIDGHDVGAEYWMPYRCSGVPRLEEAAKELASNVVPLKAKPQTTPVAELAAEYDRWHDLYLKTGDLQEAEQYEAEKTFKDEVDQAERAAVARMKDILLKLRITPSRDFGDAGLKARIVHEFQSYDWYNSDVDTSLDNGEKLASVLVLELMAMNDLSPMPKREMSPAEFLPSLAVAAE